MRIEVNAREVITVAMVIYVLSPVDCFPESRMGARGLIDDLIVIWLMAIGFAAWFTLVIVAFETSTAGPPPPPYSPPPRIGSRSYTHRD